MCDSSMPSEHQGPSIGPSEAPTVAGGEDTPNRAPDAEPERVGAARADVGPVGPAPDLPHVRHRGGGIARQRRHADCPRRRIGAPVRYHRMPDLSMKPTVSCVLERSDDLVSLIATLRATVCVYVAARGRAGIPLCDVLPEVEALVRDANILEPFTRMLLFDRIVRWTVEAYVST